MFHISAQAKYTHFKKGRNILSFKNIFGLYKSKYPSVVIIYASGLRKHGLNIDMASNYVIWVVSIDHVD